MPSPALSLQDVFATLPDPRQPRGSRHPLRALLTLTTGALRAGLRSLEAIAQCGRDQGLAFRWLLGFTRFDSPSNGCLSYLFRRLDIAAYEQALARWVVARCPELGDAIAWDGKPLRGAARRVRSRTAPEVLAAIRNVVVPLLEGVEAKSKAAAWRRLARVPLEAFALLTNSPPPDN